MTALIVKRVTGTGNDQYDHGDTQAFEDFSASRLADELRDEILDAIVYAIMWEVTVTGGEGASYFMTPAATVMELLMKAIAVTDEDLATDDSDSLNDQLAKR